MEIIHHEIQRGRIRYALFDFDGTLSLIREGWQQVMIPMMVEILIQTPRHESAAEVLLAVKEYVTRLTGKQTIYQMMQLADEIAKRGGQPQEPLYYKKLYLSRLWERIKDRVAALKEGKAKPVDYLVPGSIELLDGLRARNVKCFLASGTDEVDVVAEADVLRLTAYFEDIRGAQDDYRTFSKKMVIERLIQDNKLDGCELVAFGDGYVEIEETKRVNGIAVGVATNEAERQGVDEWKRSRLIQAGADIIIPDYRHHKEVLAYLFGD
jgi:phosphoglycolate phosphatase-like HAD superfamily hydrolase